MMFRFRIFILILFIAAWVHAQPRDAVRAQIDAATSNAISALREEIKNARITPTLTIGQYLEHMDRPDGLDDVIQRAQQIGGPRWIDDQTCQVRLEISGQRVAHALISLAAVRPRVSPMPPAALDQRLGDIKSRTFAATGTSISADRVVSIRPMDAAGAWSHISDDVRSQAVNAARQDANEHLLESIRPIEVESGTTVDDLLQREPVQQAVQQWLATRPVTGLRFKEDLHVEVEVSAPSDELFNTLLNSARAADATALPADQQTIEQLRREFAKRVTGGIGRAGVSQQPIQTQPATRIELPDRPPMWVMQVFEAEGTSPRREHPLKTKSAAEAAAEQNLRQRIDNLELTRGLTIGQAARQDPAIARAVDRTMMRNRLSKVEWRGEQGIMVRMQIDPNDLWHELRRAVGY